MAIDRDAHRVLVVFRSPPILMALSSEDGHVAAKTATCGDADDVFVDAERHRVYVSCGEGVVDVFAADAAGYRRLARVPTVSGARTSLFVPERDRLFVAVRAKWNEPAAIWVFHESDGGGNGANAGGRAHLLVRWCAGLSTFRRNGCGCDGHRRRRNRARSSRVPSRGSRAHALCARSPAQLRICADWEATIEGELAHTLAGGDVPGTSLIGNIASLKTVLREGSLQERPGPSIATEFDILLPGISDEHGTGVNIIGIV
jgi:hypothetical protein